MAVSSVAARFARHTSKPMRSSAARSKRARPRIRRRVSDVGRPTRTSSPWPMTLADLDMVADRLSESTRQELNVTATELTPGCYEVELTEDRARDLASKSANLGLAAIA